MNGIEFYLCLEFLENRKDIQFTGYDIVTSNIESHKSKFSHRPWQFKQHDIVSDKLETGFDLIMSRQHISQMP